MEHMNVAVAVWPDVQELRMLRALVREGVAASRHGLYAVHFHGWHVRVWQYDTALENLMHIDIRSSDGMVCTPFAFEKLCFVGDEVVL